MAKELDLLDKKIMYELDKNSRIPASAIAKKIKKSKETVNFRINRIIKKKYIKGFYALINSAKLGWFSYKVCLKFRNMAPAKEEEVFQYLKEQDNIAYLACVEGYYNCIFIASIQKICQFADLMEKFTKEYGIYIQEKNLSVIYSAHRFTQKLFNAKETGIGRQIQRRIESTNLSKAENKILNIISGNARMPLAKAGKICSICQKQVKYWLRKLEKENIILGYIAPPDFTRLGFHAARINISLSEISAKEGIIQFFSLTNRCMFIFELLGKHDLCVEVYFQDYNELKEIMCSFRNQFVNKYNSYDISTINKEYIHLINLIPKNEAFIDE